MRLTAREDVFEQPEAETRALELTEMIRQEFDRIEEIEIVDYALVSEADFSLADLRATLRWDYDYLSYREGTAKVMRIRITGPCGQSLLQSISSSFSFLKR